MTMENLIDITAMTPMSVPELGKQTTSQVHMNYMARQSLGTILLRLSLSQMMQRILAASGILLMAQKSAQTSGDNLPLYRKFTMIQERAYMEHSMLVLLVLDSESSSRS